MKTEIIRQFDIVISCDEAQAEVICDALQQAYRPLKDANGYANSKATVLREARNVFAKAVGKTYMGDDM